MIDRLSRIREIVCSARSGGRPAAPVGEAGVRQRAARLASALGGVALETDAGPCVLIERIVDCDVPHGLCDVGDGPALDAASLQVLAPDRAGRTAHGPPVFLDLETTGLSGGVGTRAFVVGCGRFQPGVFEIRQFLLASFAAERALLDVVSDWLAQAGWVVTFNGKAFDLPVMETRWQLHRLEPPLGQALHLDMLYTARRLWREGPGHTRDAAGSGWSVGPPGAPRSAWAGLETDAGIAGTTERCSLGALERHVLGVMRTGDVPGSEAPERYFDYVRTGDPLPLAPVLEHNRLDLVSLAALTLMAVRLVRQGPAATHSPHQCLALGRIYERAGAGARAAECFAQAAGVERSWGDVGPIWVGAPASDRGQEARQQQVPRVAADALCRLGRYLRRHRRYGEAASAWRRILDLADVPPAIEQEATEALAIHHEHRVRNLPAARGYVLRALETGAARRRAAARSRLARLDRKLAVQQKDGAAAVPLSMFPPERAEIQSGC